MSYNALDYDFENEIDISFGVWLKERRRKKGLSLDYTAFTSGIPYKRLYSIENGETSRGITKQEAINLAKVYGLDSRSILRKAAFGDFE